MQSTLQEHILGLENRLQELSEGLTKPALSKIDYSRIQSEMRVAELALTCYLKGFEIEQKIYSQPGTTRIT